MGGFDSGIFFPIHEKPLKKINHVMYKVNIPYVMDGIWESGIFGTFLTMSLCVFFWGGGGGRVTME